MDNNTMKTVTPEEVAGVLQGLPEAIRQRILYMVQDAAIIYGTK